MFDIILKFKRVYYNRKFLRSGDISMKKFIQSLLEYCMEVLLLLLGECAFSNGNVDESDIKFIIILAIVLGIIYIIIELIKYSKQK